MPSDGICQQAPRGSRQEGDTLPRAFKDVNPQVLRIAVTETAANTYKETDKPTPVTNLGNGRLLIMEILRVTVSCTPGDQGDGDVIAFHLRDRSSSSVNFYDSAGVLVAERFSTKFTTSGGHTMWYTREYNFHDGNGNGLLYAKDSIFAGIVGINQGSALSAYMMILYRMKEVEAAEYIGIVQD